MLPDGVRFFNDCSRWTGGLLADGPALAFSPGAGVAEFELGSEAFVRLFAAAADAPRRGAALGGMLCGWLCAQVLCKLLGAEKKVGDRGADNSRGH